jgi:acetyltransferase-like isoleucine patch superfamily enzyme
MTSGWNGAEPVRARRYRARTAATLGGEGTERTGVALDTRDVLDNGRAWLNARWALRHADELGTRVRLRGRPAVTNHGRMVIGERVQLVSTIATLELVADVGGLLEIGPRTLVNFGCSLVATELVRIGAHCHIGPYTMMLDNDFHRVEPERRLERPPSKPIIVEDNVWIGARVIVMAGVTIGKDSCVGAGSVVTSDVPPRTLVAGVPARLVREL